MVLHVKPAGRIRMTRDLVHTLSEFGIRIGREACADAVVRGGKGRAAILAEIMAAGRDAEMHALDSAHRRVHAKPAVAGTPLPRVRMIADRRDHLPRVAVVFAV